MILRSGLHQAVVLLATCLLAAFQASAQSKLVRLRTGTITTPDRSNSARSANPNRNAAGIPARTDGLFLVQLESSITPDSRAQLRSLGIDLLQYVPDDAFVARFRSVDVDAVLSLPFVHWIGPYETKLKMPPALRSRVPVANDPDTAIAVLLSPDASPTDRERLRGMLRSITGESTTSFGSILRGQIPASRLTNLAAANTVLWIEPSSPAHLTDESSVALVAGPTTNHLSVTQARGYDGSGVTVAVADSGLDNGQFIGRTDLLEHIRALLYYGGLTSAADENSHGTHVAGIVAGRGISQEGDEYGYYGLGVAPGAQLVIQRIFDGEGNFRSPPSYTALVNDAMTNGATIGNNSWTIDTQGRYDLTAREFDGLVRDGNSSATGNQPCILVFAAGNAGPGPQTIGSPAVAKNVIAVGASFGPRTNFFTFDEGPNNMASFSSRGPAEDGRIKPDLVAPGTWIASLFSSYGSADNVSAVISDEFAFLSGTSQAAPHVAGAAAAFVQFYRDTHSGATPSPALVKAALINSASKLLDPDISTSTPNMDEGWGRANVAALIQPDRVFQFVEQSARLSTGQSYQQAIFVNRSDVPLKITMAYTDFPGFPGAVPALINDLDLELVGPDGRVYRGNQFDHGISIPDPNGRDTLNNVEGIVLPSPTPGEYLLRVRAKGVSADAVTGTNAPQQDFALVASGGLPGPNEGLILTDRTAYRAPGRIEVKLLDAALAGQPTVTLMARSATESNGQTFVMSAAASSGSFTGSIATALGGPINDGVLQIAHGDWIRIGHPTLPNIPAANATVDLIPPAMTNVGSTNAFGKWLVACTTDEAASVTVWYGTAPGNLDRSATNSAFTLVPRVELESIQPGQTYYYIVIATDSAGNSRTNGIGAPYSFTTGQDKVVLLVDAYEPDPADPVIPLTSYTDALTTIGINFDVWSLSSQGALPEFASLQPYSIVIWRINDSFRRPNDSIPPAQQAAIQQYLDGGGSFLMTSMSIIPRLLNQGTPNFLTNVLHVQRFLLNPDPLQHCINCDEDFLVPTVAGTFHDPVGDGISVTLDYSGYSPNDLVGPDFADTFTPSTNATPVLREPVSGRICAMHYPKTGQDSRGRVVFASVPLDAFPENGFPPNTREGFLRRVIQFLNPGVGGIGTIALNQNIVTAPDVLTIEMADSDLSGDGSATVTVRTDSNPPLVVLLAETTRRGLYRGTVPVVESGGQIPPGTLGVTSGETIHAEYFDQSAGASVEATALVDLAKPGISSLSITTGYFDAVIEWTTSKPTDSLVQYGESFFLGSTDYRPELQTSHSVRLIGLLPDRTYYLKVVVRDEAGNLASTTDNGGNFDQFQTLPPLRPPFFDNMETPGSITNWVVLSSDDSQRAWSVGPPNDGQTSMPCPTCSGVNAWASNLYGEPADVIDTYLISPGIDLRGANVAELRFQQSYNFTLLNFDTVNQGELMISTNVLTEPIPITQYHQSIPDWQEAVVDLTPYAGRVVFLIWHHQFRSASTEAPLSRPGWVIDEVRVTASNVPAGSIRVTNNLSQARYTVRRGNLVQSGQGNSQLFTNLPPGSYTVTFDSVPYYNTPAPKTNTLASGVLLNIAGEYTFSDTNSNGMSDAWEQAFFGTVSPNRTAQTDTDHDGFTDYAEFIAGSNPVQANSHLFIQPPFAIGSSLLRLSWPTVPGRSYQLQAYTSSSPGWSPLSGWIRAATEITAVIIPPPSPGVAQLYRVEVRP